MHGTTHKTVQARGSLRRYGGGAQPQARLVCFSWCGAGASVYRRLAPGLPPHIELLAVQLPGREERFAEQRLRRMEQIVSHLIDELAAMSDLPLVLFGHSMGAMVAYEMALALQAAGRAPAALIVSGHAAPRSREASNRCWHTADEDAFLANIAELGGTPSDVLADRQMMAALIPLLKADYEVLETYTHRTDASLSCPLFACAGESDREVTPDGLAAWQRFSSGPYRMHWFSGGHFYLCTQPRALTRCLEQWIGAALGTGTDL